MPKSALWTLRLSIAALALASARNAWVPGSEINSWLFMKAGLPESVASGVDVLGAAIMVGVVISALVRPSRVLLLTGATWMLCVALARWDNPGATADLVTAGIFVAIDKTQAAPPMHWQHALTTPP